MPTTKWDESSHDAQRYGTSLLRALHPGAAVSVPEVAVRRRGRAPLLRRRQARRRRPGLLRRLGHDCPRCAAAQPPGRRPAPGDHGHQQRGVGRGGESARAQRAIGPGDPEWEALGIFEHITRPRMTAAITGRTPDGAADQGRLQVHRRVPDGRGLRGERRVPRAHATSTPTTSNSARLRGVAPLLWLRAGGAGPIVAAHRRRGNAAPVRLDGPLRRAVRPGPLAQLRRRTLPETARPAFIVTDSPATFAGIAAELPAGSTRCACTRTTCRCSARTGGRRLMRYELLDYQRDAAIGRSSGSARAARLARARRPLVVRAVGDHRLRQDRDRDRRHRGAVPRLHRPRRRRRSAAHRSCGSPTTRR